MGSVLIITSVERLQAEIVREIASLKGIPGIFVSLNKPQKGTEEFLKEGNVNVDKVFFIDCVTSVVERDDVLHVPPNKLEKLGFAIGLFMKEIPGEKFLAIDALSTLLIYNDENKVAAFVKEISGYAAKSGVKVIALSPKTKGEELLNKIFNFFDEVKER